MTKPLEPPAAADDQPRSHSLFFRWSQPTSPFLDAASLSRRELNAVVRSSARLTLDNAPARFPALRSHLQSAPPVYALDVAFLDDAGIHELNLDHRGKNKPTDVLSYPLWEALESAEADADLSGFWAFEGQDETGDEAPAIALGDLIISIQTAARQADELRHSLQDELAFLTIHGVLHLLGYNHGNARDRKEMFKQQDIFFANWQSQRARRRRKTLAVA